MIKKCNFCNMEFESVRKSHIYCSTRCSHKKKYYNNPLYFKNKHAIYSENNKIKISNHHKKYYKNNIEYIKKYAKEYRLKNKEKLKIYHIKKYLKQCGDIKEKRKIYYSKNKDKILERDKKYYINNKTKIQIRNQRYLIKYLKLPETKIKRREYNRFKLKTDINYKIKSGLRSRIGDAIKRNMKCGHIDELIGCTVQELKQYLESKWLSGMSWDNYSFRGWHIDHIIPCASFDLSKPEEQKKCFNYANLQPLWWKDNLRKGKSVGL